MFKNNYLSGITNLSIHLILKKQATFTKDYKKMYTAMWKLVLVSMIAKCYCWSKEISQLYEGDTCTISNASGVCKIITECPQAGADLKKGIQPQLCGFRGKVAIVCCQSVAPRNLKSVHQDCGPIPAEASRVQRVGSKAWDKCIEFLQYVYPCKNVTIQKSCLVQGNNSSCNDAAVQRKYTCKHDTSGGRAVLRPVYQRKKRSERVRLVRPTAVGGENATENEFPHMALLGYGMNVESAEWLCGGSVVSENYVLTAGHCTFARNNKVEFIRVGMVQISSPIDPTRIHKVSHVIKHHNYKPPNKYNDIALLKTATPIILDSQVYPACLHTGNAIDDNEMIATGWGALSYGGKSADVLQKVKLQKFSTNYCTPFIPSSRKLENGLNHESQICAGHLFLSRDTCQGDSGGPLQIYNQDVNCMYTVVGVTSFGWGCGIIGSPGVYTRVSHYIPWIESIVWP